MMKDSTVDPNWLREQMTKNPPSLRPNGDVFSGPVRLSFPNIWKPGRPSDEMLRQNPDATGKYGAALLFPLNTDMSIFQREWTRVAREAFPHDWDPDGNPIKLNSPFYDQRDKAFGAKPLMGYTPGAIHFSATTHIKPHVYDTMMKPITDESRVYPGVWAFVTLNLYHYPKNKTAGPTKRGVAFGLQQVMIIADDTKLGGGGGGDPKQAFAGVTITAQANVASKFDAAPNPQAAPAGAGIMPSGGHVGQPGTLPMQPLPAHESDDERAMREMMG